MARAGADARPAATTGDAVAGDAVAGDDTKERQSHLDPKRTREKQRRRALHSRFVALAQIVRDIDLTDLAGDQSNALPSGPLNRVDLISRTMAQLRQLRRIRRRSSEDSQDAKRQICQLRKEHEELQRQLAYYKMCNDGGAQLKSSTQVMMMVPMMIPQSIMHPPKPPQLLASPGIPSPVPARLPTYPTQAPPLHPGDGDGEHRRNQDM